ncbi:FKBP-type peptidyl-prolyl cis-trans isomerase [Flavitalea flava]
MERVKKSGKIGLGIALTGVLIYGVISGCGKGGSGYTPCTDVAVTADSSALLNFARAKGIIPVKDTTGLYYEIISQGTGPVPDYNSFLYVNYIGTKLDGIIFDSTTNYAKTGFRLSGLIPGWQIGLTKIQEGGHIKLLIPSTYAYGCQGSGSVIPPNSPLFFDITLVKVQ